MYILPKWGDAGLLSTHIDSRSPAPPGMLAAHAPAVHVIPSGEVHMPTPCPPHPVARSPANHMLRDWFHTTMGSPKLVPCPVQMGDAPAPPGLVQVAPPSTE